MTDKKQETEPGGTETKDPEETEEPATTKTTPRKPSKPTLKSKTQTTITVVAVSGQQYSINGGKTWQNKGTFTGLTPNTKYSIITRIAATKTTNVSPSSAALAVTTNKKTLTKADKVTKSEKAAAKIKLNAGLNLSQTGSKVTVTWGRVAKAERYEVYAGYCGTEEAKLIKTIKNGSTVKMSFKKLNGKKLNLKKNIKVYVVAYRSVNGKLTKLARSISLHAVGRKNAKYTNVRKITLSKSSYTLKAKKTAQIKAKVVLVDKNKKQISDAHAPQFRYASSNKKVATVTSGGKVKAVGKGTCYVYVYAKNGCAKKVKSRSSEARRSRVPQAGEWSVLWTIRPYGRFTESCDR